MSINKLASKAIKKLVTNTIASSRKANRSPEETFIAVRDALGRLRANAEGNPALRRSLDLEEARVFEQLSHDMPYSRRQALRDLVSDAADDAFLTSHVDNMRPPRGRDVSPISERLYSLPSAHRRSRGGVDERIRELDKAIARSSGNEKRVLENQKERLLYHYGDSAHEYNAARRAEQEATRQAEEQARRQREAAAEAASSREALQAQRQADVAEKIDLRDQLAKARAEAAAARKAEQEHFFAKIDAQHALGDAERRAQQSQGYKSQRDRARRRLLEEEEWSAQKQHEVNKLLQAAKTVDPLKAVGIGALSGGAFVALGKGPKAFFYEEPNIAEKFINKFAASDEGIGVPTDVAAGIGMGAASGALLSYGLNQQNVEKSRDLLPPGKFREFLTETMKATPTADPNVYMLPTKDGKRIAVALNAARDEFAANNRTANTIMESLGNTVRSPERGTIFIDGAKDKTLFMHELGHATGSPRWAKAAPRVLQGGRALALASGLSSLYTLSEANKDGISRSDLEGLKTRAQVETGLAAAGWAPTLAEEARASVRAKALANKFNVKLNPRALMGGYKTYLGAALGAAALPTAALLSTSGNLERKEKEVARNRAAAAAALGVLGAGAYGYSKIASADDPFDTSVVASLLTSKGGL